MRAKLVDIECALMKILLVKKCLWIPKSLTSMHLDMNPPFHAIITKISEQYIRRLTDASRVDVLEVTSD